MDFFQNCSIHSLINDSNNLYQGFFQKFLQRFLQNFLQESKAFFRQSYKISGGKLSIDSFPSKLSPEVYSKIVSKKLLFVNFLEFSPGNLPEIFEELVWVFRHKLLHRFLREFTRYSFGNSRKNLSKNVCRNSWTSCSRDFCVITFSDSIRNSFEDIC